MAWDDPVDRRTFVKGCVRAGVAGLGVAAGLGLGSPFGVRRQPEPAASGERAVSYLGAQRVQGPAERALPLLPVAVAGDGVVEGRPRLLGQEVRDWYRYCGHRDAAGLQVGYEPATEALVYQEGDRTDPWYGDKVGEPVRVGDFGDPPQGAPVIWRSQGREGKDVVTAVVLRLDPEAVEAGGGQAARVAAAGLSDGLLAFVTFCTHFCCVPGWKHAPKQAKAAGAWEKIFCSCCYSQFDPFRIVEDGFQLEAGQA